MRINLNSAVDAHRFNTRGQRVSRLRFGGRSFPVVVAMAVAAVCSTAAFAVKPPPAKRLEQAAKKRDVPAEAYPGRIRAIGIKPEDKKAMKAAARLEAEGKGPRATIKVEDAVHDFGTVWIGPVLKHTFKITNEGELVLKITKVKPSCGCTVAGNYPRKLNPGETGEIPISVASKKLRGKFEKSITVSSNDPATPNLRLRVRGQVKRYVDVNPSSVQLGKLYGSEPKEKVLKLTNNTETPMELTLGPLPDGNFEIKLVPTTPGQAYELHVTAKPPFSPGVFKRKIIINTNLEVQKTLTVDLRGAVPRRLDVKPTTINVRAPSKSARQAGRPTTRVVRLTNYGATPVKLLDATVDDPALSVTFKEQKSGTAYNVRIQFPVGYEPPEGGRTLTLKTDDAELPIITVPIKSLQRSKKASARRRPAQDMVGKKVPSFSLTTTDGKSLASAELGDTITVLDFFAVNCGFCKKQLPRLETVRAKYADKGVRFVVVSQTMRNKKFTDEQVMDKVKALGFQGEVATDPNNTVGPLFKATSYPTMVILGKTGKVEAVNIGNVADLETRLAGQLDALIAGKPIPKVKVAEATTKKKTPKRKRASELIGKAAPQFSIETFDGKTVSNAEFAAHPATVLNFVATNCGYCKKQIPRLEKMRETYVEKGVRFVNIVQTMRKTYTKEQVIETLSKLGSKQEVAQDVSNEIGRKFNATSYPTMVVIGKSGKVEAVNSGNLADLETRLKGQLDALIAGKPLPKVAATPKTPKRKRPGDLIGKPAPAFATETIEGKKLSNAEFAGYPATVLNFFAANCGYCKKQIPRLEKIRQTFAEKGVRFVNVSQKMGRKAFSQDEVVAKMKGFGSQGELAIDHENKIGRSFNATGYPTMIVVGKSGKVEAVNVGNLGDLEKRVTAQLTALIEGKPVPKFASATPKAKSRRRPAEDLVGKPAPQFSINTLAGKGISNTDFANHPATVLNFVAPNCGFCRRQIPNVEKVRAEYEAKGVRFVNISQTMRKPFTADEASAVFEKAGSKLEFATDKNNQIGKLFKAVSYPTMIVVNRAGKIANVNIGAKQNLVTLLKGQLDALIKGKSSAQAPAKSDAKAVVGTKP